MKTEWKAGEALKNLASYWREEADVLNRRGAPELGALLQSCASELEVRCFEAEMGSVGLKEAAHISGFSYSALQKMTAGGRLENVGSPNRPRVRVKDLPRKPPKPEGPDLAGKILGSDS